MIDLPKREYAEGILILRNVQVANNADGIAIVRSYVRGELMTRKEFIDSLDMEAASHMYYRLSGQHFRAEPIIAAALGEDTK